LLLPFTYFAFSQALLFSARMVRVLFGDFNQPIGG
jgi:hypothetical protein